MKRIYKTIAVVLTVIMILGALPMVGIAAADEGWVIYVENPADENRHERIQYLGEPNNPQTPYYYSTTNNFSGTVLPFYVMQGDPGDLNVQRTRRSNWDEMQASAWPMVVGGSITYNYGKNAWSANPTHSTEISLKDAQEAYRITMNYGYPFSDIGLKAPYNLTPTQAQNATNVAVQRLMGLFTTGKEYTNFLKICNADVDAARRVGNYEWFIEQKAREFLHTKDIETKLKLNPTVAVMEENGGMFEKTIRVFMPKTGLPESGFLNVFTLHNVSFPAGSEIWNGSTKLQWEQQYTLDSSTKSRDITFKVPVSAENSGQSFVYDVSTKSLFTDASIGVFYSYEGTRSFGLVADKQEFPDPNTANYKQSPKTRGRLKTGDMGYISVHKTGEGKDAGGLDGAIIGLYEQDGKKLIEKQTTNGGGYVNFGPLAAGVYKVRELAVPNAGDEPEYDLNKTLYSVTVTGGETATLKISNSKNKIIIEAVTKGEDADVNGLAGCKVGLYEQDGTTLIEEKQVDGSGRAEFAPVLLGDYIVKETFVPAPYVLGKNGTHEDTIRKVSGVYGTPRYSVSIENIKAKGTVTIERQDRETGTTPQGDAILNGARYELYKANVKAANLTTLPDSRTVKSAVLPLGAYDVVETGTPTGYLPPDPNNPAVTVNIPYKDMYTPIVDSYGTVKSYVIKGKISIGKFASHDLTGELPEGVKQPLENVVFTATLKSSSLVYDTIITNADGKAITKLLPYGNYTMTETSGVDGFDKVPPFDCFVSVNNHEYWHYVQDDIVERYLRVEKKDAETGRTIPLAGTTFQVLDAGKNPITFEVIYPQPATMTEIQTDTSGTVYLPNKLVFGQYYLCETQAPHGYLLNKDDIPFEISSDGSQPEIVSVSIPDKPAMGTVTVSKTVDEFIGIEDLKPVYKTVALENAVFEVVAADNIVTPDGTVRALAGEVVDTITTDNAGKALSKPLYLGAYYLREISVPDGVILDRTEQHFELVYQDQNTPIVNVEKTIENTLRKVNIYFTKTAETMLPDEVGYTYNEAAGFEFGLYSAQKVLGKNGETLLDQDQQMAKSVSDEQGTVRFENMPNVPCYVKEIHNNENYMPSDTKYPVEISVTQPESLEYIGMINHGIAVKNHLVKRQLEIYNYEKDHEDIPIAGGEFDVINAATNKTVHSGVTDVSGYITLPDIAIGGYIVKQTKAHDGYIINEEEFNITVSGDAGVFKVKVPNEKRYPDIQITKMADKEKVSYGDIVTWTITVENKGTMNAFDVVVKDERLKGIKPFDENGNYYIGELAAGGNVKIESSEQVVADAGTKIKNVAIVSAKLPDGTPLPDNEAEAEYEVIAMPMPKISVTKTVDKELVQPGDTVTWSIVIENTGEGAAKDVVVKDERLKGFAPFDKDGLYTLKELKAGAKEQTQVSEKVVAEAGTKVKNVVIVSAKTPDDKPLPDEKAEAEYEVVTQQQPKIVVTKTVDKPQALSGDTVTWTITIENKGSGTAKDVTVKDERLKGIAPFDSNGVYVIGSLGAGGRKEITATEKVVADVGAKIKNVVVVSAKTPDDKPLPDEKGEAEYEVVAAPKPNILITKTADKQQAKPGDTVTWTITIANTGEGTAKNIVVKDERLRGIAPFDGEGKYLIPELKKGEKREVTASETVDGSAGTVIKNVAIVTAEAPDGTKLPEVRAEAQYTIVNKDGTISQGTTQGSGGSSGGGAQTGRDGLPVWALVIAVASILVATVVLIRRKKRK